MVSVDVDVVILLRTSTGDADLRSEATLATPRVGVGGVWLSADRLYACLQRSPLVSSHGHCSAGRGQFSNLPIRQLRRCLCPHPKWWSAFCCPGLPAAEQRLQYASHQLPRLPSP